MALSTSSISITISAPSSMSGNSNISSSSLGTRTASSIVDEPDNNRVVKKARISSEIYSSNFALAPRPVGPLEAQPAGGPLLTRSLSIITHISSENEASHIPLPSTPSSAFLDSPLPPTPSSTTTLVRDSSDTFSSLQPIFNRQPSHISNGVNKRYMDTTSPICQIPAELFSKIAAFLRPREIARVTQTNRFLHSRGFLWQTITSKHLKLDHSNPKVLSVQLRHFFQPSLHVTSIEASSLTNEDLEQIAIKYPNVQKIIVDDARAITNIEYLIESLMRLHELKDLRLYQASNITEKGWKSIANCTKLELLAATHNHHIFQAIQDFPVSLRILDLTNCRHTQIDVELHLERLTNLNTLVLSKTTGFMGTQHASGDLALKDLLKLNSKLECLYLNSSSYTVEDFPKIFAYFTQLKTVSVHNCGSFDNSSLSALPSTVEILDMSYCLEIESPALAAKLSSQKWKKLHLNAWHIDRSCLEALLISSKDSLELLDIEDNAQTLSPDDLTLLDQFTQLKRPEETSD